MVDQDITLQMDCLNFKCPGLRIHHNKTIASKKWMSNVMFKMKESDFILLLSR